MSRRGSAGQTIALTRLGRLWRGRFRAMASPCEVLIDTPSGKLARQIVSLACEEALRIERHFSRYRDDSIVSRINQSGGQPVTVDTETATLLDFAARCHAFSDGLFDITSGVLRRAWHFDGSDRLPRQADIERLLPLVGWHRVSWQRPVICLPDRMEIDVGGIGKEYAVDRTLQLIRQRTDAPVLVNFGGDLHASDAPRSGEPWQVGLPGSAGTGRQAGSGGPLPGLIPTADQTSCEPLPDRLELRRGALTTSGDAHRYLERDGVRFGHVLDPTTGWPAPGAPSSVTVASSTCTQAGVLSTLALLKGVGAEAFLDREGVTYWCQRSPPRPE